MKSVVILFALITSSACELAQPFQGPGYDLSKGLTTKAEGPYTASSTLLALKDGDVAQKAFDDHMKILQETLKTQPGLIGYSLSTVIGSNKEYRTLAVWESEDDMLAYVTGEDHTAAMQDMVDKAESGKVTSWTITRAEMPPTWDDAKKHIDGTDAIKAY